ncbi:MAG: hypothetical protein ACXVQY_03640 [Actinomycetota bacterium]
MAKRRRPVRAMLHALDRALLGPIMIAAAIIIERKVVVGIKKRGSDVPATGVAADRSQEPH